MDKLVVIVLMWIMFSGCSSLLYSPSVGLPTNPLKNGELDLHGGVELFPETAPDDIMTKTSSGATLQIGYGLSDKNSLYLRGWFSSAGEEESRGGISLHLISQLKKFENAGLYFIPKIGYALDGFAHGIGFELPIIYQYCFNNKVSVFGGLGGAYGTELDDKAWGWGFTSHVGAGFQLSENLRINTELTGVYQNNSSDDVSHFIISPAIGLGYTFKKRK